MEWGKGLLFSQQITVKVKQNPKCMTSLKITSSYCSGATELTPYNAYTVDDICINLTSADPAQIGDADLSPLCV